MSSKKDENNKNIGYFRFKRFFEAKKHSITIWHLPKETKIFLVFCYIYVINDIDEKNLENFKFKKNELKKIYKEFNGANSKNELIAKTQKNFTKKYEFTKFYNNLYSFYENSWILNKFNKKEKRKKQIWISDNKFENYSMLNKNIKFILSFIKEISPIKFNSIYRKILLLS